MENERLALLDRIRTISHENTDLIQSNVELNEKLKESLASKIDIDTYIDMDMDMDKDMKCNVIITRK